MRYKSYSGMVLKQTPYKETDVVVSFWSWEEGKVRLLVRGVKKPGSRLRGVFAPLAWLHLEVVSGRAWPIVTGVRLISEHRNIVTHLQSAALAFNMQELILRTTADRQPNAEITSLLRGGLAELNRNPASGPDFSVVFRLRLLTTLGYHIELRSCAQCGRESHELSSMGLSCLAGGILCELCRKQFLDFAEVDLKTRDFLDRIQSSANSFSQTPQEDRVKKQANDFLTNFLLLLTERQIKSQVFMEENF